MSRSYVLNFVHCVFATKGRAQLIRDPESLWAYLRGIARNRGFDILAVGGTDNLSTSSRRFRRSLIVVLVRESKANSLRSRRQTSTRFRAQDGYADMAISVSPSGAKL